MISRGLPFQGCETRVRCPSRDWAACTILRTLTVRNGKSTQEGSAGFDPWIEKETRARQVAAFPRVLKEGLGLLNVRPAVVLVQKVGQYATLPSYNHVRAERMYQESVVVRKTEWGKEWRSMFLPPSGRGMFIGDTLLLGVEGNIPIAVTPLGSEQLQRK